MSQDFESYNVGSYSPLDQNSPVVFVWDINNSGVTFESFGIVDRADGQGKAFCMKVKASGANWSKMFRINIPGLSSSGKLNTSGDLKLDYDFKQTSTSGEVEGISWLALVDLIIYKHGFSSSTSSGGKLFFNETPGSWQKGIVGDIGYAFGLDNPYKPGNFYGIKAEDTGKELRGLAIKFSNSKDLTLKKL